MPETLWGDIDCDFALRDGAAAAHAFGLPWPKEMTGRSGGDVGGIGTGSSIDFHDQRSYVPGDDPRHINWSAFARTGSYTMKLFREEVQPALDVVIDTSASMGYSAEKASRTLSLLAFLAHAAQRSMASVWFYDAQPTPNRWAASEVIAGNWSPPEPSDSEIRLDAIPFRNRSVRILISDLLFEDSPTPLVSALGHSAGTAAILAPTTLAERAPDWSGSHDFIDVETDASRTTWCDRKFTSRYQASYEAHFSTWAEAARRANILLARVASEGSLTTALGEEASPTRAVSSTR